MTYRGHIQNGVVILEGPGTKLENGTEVSVRPLKPRGAARSKARKIPSLYDRLKPAIGKAQGLPADAAVNHDHYLYGVPKRK